MGDGPPHKWPWWWTRILVLEHRFENIRSMSAYDQDGLVAPKEFWLDDDILDNWYEERKALREAEVASLNY